MTLHFHPIDPDTVAAYRAGAPDANGHAPEHLVSTGIGTPCRCCLDLVPEGKDMLVLAHRPFASLHPYAELGPIFLCADACQPHDGADDPALLAKAPHFLLKAYGSDDRIIYGTGQITPQSEVRAYAEALLSRPDVAYVDLRSARNNCFLARITRDATD